MARKTSKAGKEADSYPHCVRHAKRQKDVKLRHFFLCDACTSAWSTGPFRGSPALYNGDLVRGYCQLCNLVGDAIRLRTWFLCDICHRVAGSIGRNHVAERAIMDFWQASVKPLFPYLRLDQNDISELKPHTPGTRAGIAPIDFLVTDERTGETVFGIENKTGRSSLKDMRVFQLDVSDCDCILNEMRTLRFPVYVFHAQVLEIWSPPTMGFHSVGLWWTDIYKMAGHFKEIKGRRDESRNAAYFGKKAFAPIATFAQSIHNGTHFVLRAQFEQAGIPALYR